MHWSTLNKADSQHFQQTFERSKAELLQLKPHPFIRMRNFINKKVENRKTTPTFMISILKVVC